MPVTRRRRVSHRFLTTGLAALLAATSALVVTATPASAGESRFILPTSASWTDARQPSTAAPEIDGTVPVGTWTSGDDKHTSRAYFTYDLSPFQGKRIIRALGLTEETAVNECAKPREIELWRTEVPTTALTWETSPAVREKIADVAPTAPCQGQLEVPLTEAVRQAVEAGQTSITLMARIAGDHEEKLPYGRRIRELGISIEANTPPDVPTSLAVNGLPCADELHIGTATPYLAAKVTDADAAPSNAEPVTATFAWWPVADPTMRTEWTSPAKAAGSSFSYTVAAGQMVDGTYAFAVRATDRAGDTSTWSAECRFTVDTTSPAQPTVSSTDYPADDGWYGGPGIPGQFTFSAGGDTDTVQFRYSVSGQPSTDVAADAPGGSATVTLTPDRDGPRTLTVEAIDLAGNRSPATSYVFLVRTTSPTITDADPTAGYGQPRTLTFTPRMEDVVEYTYRLDDGPEQTVPATADGTATVTITPTKPGYNTVYVRSRTAGDLPSGEGSYRFYLATKPTVSSVEYPINKFQGAVAGTPGTFVLQAGMPGVTEFVYSFDGRPAETVAAGADGSASVGYTPTTAGIHRITVHTRTGDGIVSETFSGTFYASRAS
ncbi:Ig-like domain-containing protein [Micromonospora sp. URMC 107]|uniref:Ig-like domain-containing protein n=1 Tax=Micromonospora sp. URMC 107 TaxID=3423418 RepID=UPI003F1DDE9C